MFAILSILFFLIYIPLPLYIYKKLGLYTSNDVDEVGVSLYSLRDSSIYLIFFHFLTTLFRFFYINPTSLVVVWAHLGVLFAYLFCTYSVENIDKYFPNFWAEFICFALLAALWVVDQMLWDPPWQTTCNGMPYPFSNVGPRNTDGSAWSPTRFTATVGWIRKQSHAPTQAWGWSWHAPTKQQGLVTFTLCFAPISLSPISLQVQNELSL